ncbi:MAG: hypothetical protein J6S91_02965 [Treponema sp.]|nr:hypothetical protein [Treponema sp.]
MATLRPDRGGDCGCRRKVAIPVVVEPVALLDEDVRNDVLVQGDTAVHHIFPGLPGDGAGPA